ncbi:MAG: hypothetical protein FWH01_09450, partial [Oscillospiraceae bacterium]|nr:hypothetical protein [Oscillospiraceae bacterium]
MIKNNFFYICISAMLLVVISIQPVYVYASNTTNAPAPASAAPTAKPYHFSVAVGESALLKNGRHRYDINPPMLVYDTVYMELGDICELLGIQWQWLLNDGGEILINDGNDSAGRTDGNDDVGHSDDNDRVNRANNNDDINGIDDVLRFKHFVRYDDLSAPQPQPQTQPRKYFAVDGKIYVPAVELADYTGYGVTYADGIMTMSPDGVEVFYEGNAFGAIDISGSERLLYNAYSEPAAHVVNPYKAYSYNDMTADALRLERMYPELIRTSGIGYSVEGREILLIKFGKGDIEIFVCGTHHAREYISTTYLMYAIDQYAYAYAAGAKWEAYDIIDLLEKVKFCIIPMLNPDGVNLVQNGIESIKDPEYVKSLSLAGSRYGYASWKANINGVDINRNYDFNWTHEKAYEYPRGYLAFGGDAPASEPETQV